MKFIMQVDHEFAHKLCMKYCF